MSTQWQQVFQVEQLEIRLQLSRKCSGGRQASQDFTRNSQTILDSLKRSDSSFSGTDKPTLICYIDAHVPDFKVEGGNSVPDKEEKQGHRVILTLPQRAGETVIGPLTRILTLGHVPTEAEQYLYPKRAGKLHLTERLVDRYLRWNTIMKTSRKPNIPIRWNVSRSRY